MSESGGNRPGDEALHDASRAAIERVQGDPKVQELLGKLDAMVASGEDLPLEEVAPPPPAEPPAGGARSEQFDSVRVGPSHKVAHEDKIIVQPKRSLRQVAEEAGVKLDDFKKLEAGNKTARTQVAVRILDHLDEIYAALPRTVGGGTAMLGQPDSVRGAAAAAGAVTDAGAMDPAVRTVGGGTIKGMPAPVPTKGAAAAVDGPPSSGAPVSGAVEPSQAPSRASAGPSQRAALLVILALAAVAAVVTAVMLRPGDGESAASSAAPSGATAAVVATAPTAAEPATSSAAEPADTASADASAASAEPPASAEPSAATPSARPPSTAVRPPSTGKPPSPPPTTTGHKPLFERK